MTKRAQSASPKKDEATGTWGFVVDLGAGPDSKGEWQERRQARRRGFPTKKAAQETLDGMRVDSRAGTYVAPARRTVKDFFEQDWLAAMRRQLAESTWESYERNIRHHVVPAIGGLQLQALDGATLDKLYADLLESGRMRGKQSPGLKPRTVRYIHTILHGALDDAVKWRRVPLNAADQATPPSAKSAKAPEMKTWTGSQLASFLERTSGDRYGYAWAFLATTGCRRGEALGLRWSDVDLDQASVSIRQQVIPLPKASGTGREARIMAGTKGGEARVIELDARSVAMLRVWKKEQARQRLLLDAGYDDHGLIFPRPDGRPQHPEAFSKTFDRRVRQDKFADLPTIRLHDLRHTWATLALEAGVDVAVVSKRLGHSSPVITWSTYQHVRQGMQTDAAERVAQSIFGGGA
ncbi:MAG: Integrase [Acidimicrobiales bacterium]|nr:Integrase [Acidimicrobiales bacterium]